MDWASIITPAVISALISGAVSIVVALISYRANKKKTQLEIEKLKIELAHQDKVRVEEYRREDQLRAADSLRADSLRLQESVSAMLSALSKFGAAPDGYSHQAALSSIAKTIALTDGELAKLLTELQTSLEITDPFDGLSVESKSLLQQVRVQLGK